MKTPSLLISFLFCSIFMFAAKPQTWQLVVEAGDVDRFNTPVSLILDQIHNPSDDQVFTLHEIVSKSERKRVECQLEQGPVSRLWWILDGKTIAGKERIYELSLGNPEAVKKGVVCKADEQKISLSWNDKSVLQYSTAEVYPPDGIDQAYKRSAFIHPVQSPNGNVLTQIQPSDHYHHYGIWGPWTKINIKGQTLDFWNLAAKQGTVRYAGTNSLISGSVFGGFSVAQEHVDFVTKGYDHVAMNEKMDVKIWNIPQIKDGWLCEVSLTLSCTEDTVVLEEYRYGGGIGFRATEDWNNENSHVLTSEGNTRKNGDATRARWCNIHGDFTSGTHSGILFLTHPGNRNYPEPMRIWPEKESYGFFFEFCPIRDREWVLIPGNTYTMKYRFFCYDDTIEAENADLLWNDFAKPPRVSISTKK